MHLQLYHDLLFTSQPSRNVSCNALGVQGAHGFILRIKMKMKNPVSLVIEQSGMRNDKHFTLGLQVLDIYKIHLLYWLVTKSDKDNEKE